MITNLRKPLNVKAFCAFRPLNIFTNNPNDTNMVMYVYDIHATKLKTNKNIDDVFNELRSDYYAKNTLNKTVCFENILIKDFKIVGFDESSNQFYCYVDNKYIFSLTVESLFEIIGLNNLSNLVGNFTFIQRSKKPAFIVDASGPLHKAALMAKKEKRSSIIKHEKLQQGVIYQTPGGVYSLFLGHVSTINMTPIFLDRYMFPSPSDDNWFNTKNLSKKNKFLYKQSSLSVSKSFHVKIQSKYIEYGTLWMDFMPYHGWLFRHPEPQSKEAKSELLKHITNRLQNPYLMETTIRTRHRFTKAYSNNKYEIPFEHTLTKIKQEARRSSEKMLVYYDYKSTPENILLFAKNKLNLFALANIGPLGNYPQINSCFSEFEDYIIKPTNK
jgi:hypothetical protein